MHAYKHKYINLKLHRTQVRRKITKNEKGLTMKDSGKTIVCILSRVAMRGYLGQYHSHVFCLTQYDKIERAKV